MYCYAYSAQSAFALCVNGWQVVTRLLLPGGQYQYLMRR